MIKFFRQHATVKSITGIVLLLVLFSMIVLTIGFNIFTDALLEQYAEGAYLTAKTASQYVNADEMENYLQSGGEGEAYEQVWDNLDRLCNSSGSTFIYVIIPDITDYAHIQFIFSTIDHNTKYTKYDFGYLRETTNDEYRQKYRLLFEKNSEREIVVRDKGYIETDSHITLLIPLKDSEGNVNSLLCVQRQMDVLTNMRRKFLNRALLALVALILLVLLGQSFFLHRTLLHPLKLISDEATRFSTENTVSETKLRHSIRNEDEIGLLAGSIDRMEEEIQAYIDNLTKATDKDNELFGTERMLAALNEDTDASPESVLQNVRAAVDGFVKNAEQFDDLTMLCMEYKGDETSLKAYELDIMAENEKLSEVQSFLGQCLAKVNCPAKAQMQMELAAEEIFVNIANYAYAPEKGKDKDTPLQSGEIACLDTLGDIFNEASEIGEGTAGVSLKRAKIAARIASYAAAIGFSDDAVESLKAEMLTKYDALDEQEKKNVDDTFMDSFSLLDKAIVDGDYDSVKGQFEDAGAAEGLDTVLKAPGLKESYNVFKSAYLTMGNSED